MEGVSEFVPESTTIAPLNVLFADDDALFREVMAMNLADEGISARAFEHGQALLEFVASHGTAGYDALLLDLKMPGIDGIGSRFAPPSLTKTGQIRSSTVRLVSRTSRRDQSLARLRRMRTRGNWPCGLRSAASSTFLVPLCGRCSMAQSFLAMAGL